MATERRGSSWVGGVCLGAVLALGCNDGRDLSTPPAPAPAGPATQDGQPRLFFDDFESGEMAAWEPAEGQWDVRQRPRAGAGGEHNRQTYGTRRVDYGLSMAGDPNWTDYSVEAQVTIHDDRRGQVGLAGRLQSTHLHYELVLGWGGGGAPSWFLRQRLRHTWTTLASGRYDYQLGQPQTLRLAFRGRRLEGSVSRDGGRSFVSLGAAEAIGPTMGTGRIGLVSYGGDASFDDVLVIGDRARPARILADEANPWGPTVLLRDDSNVFPTGKPAGGWYVAPIHVTLRPHDGRVIVSGYGRAGQANCTGGTNSSRNGTSWILDPAALNPPTLFVQPINEQGEDPVSDVIYCAGHNMISGGRVFFSGGSRHPGGFPFSSERGLNYGRVFNFDTGAFTRISVKMKGGTTQLPGEKWYPTNRLMPDGQVLIFGGFTFNSGGTGDRKNRSLELFDVAAWDLNPAGDPWTVLTQHAESPFGDETTPTRGYTNLFLLPKPLPAANGGGFARSVALMAGLGKVFLFNHEPGVPGAQRQLAKTNAMIPNGSPTEKGEGSSGVQLYDGRIMFVNGGHLGADAARAYFYTPSTDSWTSVPLGVSRIYGDALFLPDGRVMIINGYVSEPGNIGDVSDPIGDVRQPEIIDPYTDPPTVTTLPAWPDLVWRGYHSVALVLKDGRILVGAGKDADHATGCEKNDMRVFEPPYLFAGGPRPVINLAEGTAMTVGGSALTVPFTGTVRTTRGVALMAPGSLTHGFDMGQRYVPLGFTDNGDGTLTVHPPENVNIAPPGDYLLHIVSTTGVPSVGKHIQLAAPPPCRYAVDGNSHSYIEAEARSRQSGPFASVADPARSGGANIAVTEAGLNHTAEPDEGKVLWYDVNVASGGNFYLWALANGPDGGSDSFWLSADGLADVQLDLPAASWGWVRTTAASLNLATGKHTLKIKVREDGALLDKILLTKDGAFTPTGLGGTALACNGLFAPTGLMATPGNGSVALSWNPVVGATSYTVKRSTTSGSGYTTVQSGITGTSFNNMGLNNGTQYFFVVSAINGAGESPNSSEVPATPVAPTWLSQDVGAVAAAGGWTLNGGVHTLQGNGADIWAANDEFRFTYQQLAGDGTITARVVTFTGTGTINANAKAGVMIRQSLAANSAHVLACLPVQGQTTQVKAIKREATGNTTSVSQTGGAPAFPRWVRVTRTGTTLTAYQSTNGTTFTQLGTPSSIAGMTGTVFVGMAVTSHVDGTNYTATFDNVTITTPMPQPPGPPTNLACSAGNGQCACSWTAPSGATSYNLKRSLTSGSGYTPIVSNHPMISFTDTTAANGTQHFYVVSANNANGEGPNSTQASCTPIAPPSAPTNLMATGGAGQATLNWTDAASNETGFKIERKPFGSPDTSFAQIATVGANVQTYLNSPVAAGAYTYRVRATNGSGDSPYSNSADATVTTPPNPPAPSNLIATVTGGNTANLTWTDNSSNETGFRVERKVGAGSYSTLASKAANSTSHSDGTLAAGTYTYRVIATGSPDSAPSNEAVVIIANPVADAYVRAGTSAGTNFGSATVLDVKHTNTVTTKRNAFLRFSLAGVAANVTSAKLRLYGNAATSAKAAAIHSVADVTWGETTITWNTPTTDAGGPAMSASPLATQTVATTAAYVEWDVTSYVQQQRTAGASLISLGVKSAVLSDEGQTTFNAREGANKPLLIINSRP